MDSILRSEMNSVRDQCDRIDYPGVPGERRLRDTCRMELGHFLLYIACAAPFPTMEQAMMISSVWTGVHPSVSRGQMQEELDSLTLPDVYENETLTAFIRAGKAERLIRLYRIYGRYMADISRNAAAEGRCSRYLEKMEKRAAEPEGLTNGNSDE